MKVLFVRNYGFGDCIWVEPIVRHFLAQGEEVLVDIHHPCIFDNYPSDRLNINCLEKIFPLTDFPINLRFQERPQMHYLEGFCQAAQIEEMEFSYPKLHLSAVEKVRKIAGDYAILHLDKNACNFRNAYGVQWEEVISYLESRGIEPIQISKTGESPVCRWVQTENFREIMSLIYHSKLFIGLDSGPSHIAASMRVPSVIFFGSVNPAFRHLDQHNKVFLQSSCPFAHCYHEWPLSFGQPCRLVGDAGQPPCCIHNASEVIEAIRSLLC